MENDVKKPLVLKILLAFLWMVFVIGPLMGFILAGMFTLLAFAHKRGLSVEDIIACVCLCLLGVVLFLYSTMLVAFGRGQDWARKSLFWCNVLNMMACFVCCLFCFCLGSDCILEMLDHACVREWIGMGIGSVFTAVSAGGLLLPSVRNWCESFDRRDGKVFAGSYQCFVKIQSSVYRIVFALCFVASCAIISNLCNIIDGCRVSLHCKIARNADVMWREAKSYFQGANGHEKNVAKARELYLEAGEKMATFNGGLLNGGYLACLGSYYEFGNGPFDQDYGEAAKWYGRGIKDPFCSGRLSVLCRNGLGVEKSVAQALELAQRAADDGFGHYLAEHYEQGLGVDRNLEKAFELRKAEPLDRVPLFEDPAALAYRVGEMYEQGIGTKTNLAEAVKWYRYASKRGSVKAQKRVEQLESKRK